MQGSNDAIPFDGLAENRSHFFALTPYALAVGSVAVATAATYGIREMRDMHTMWLYLAAVVVTSWYGGLWPGLTAVALSATSFAYFVAPPFGFAMHDPQDKVRLAFFILVAALMSYLQRSKANAERSVRSIDQRMAYVLDATGTGVWEMNLQTGVLLRSPRLEQIYGRRGLDFPEAYVAFLGYVHPADRAFFHDAITRAMETGEEYHIQHRIVLPDGTARSIETRGRVVRDAAGRPARLLGVTADATGRPGAIRPPATGAVV